MTVKKSSSIFLQKSVLITFIVENTHFVVAVEIEKVNISMTTPQTSM